MTVLRGKNAPQRGSGWPAAGFAPVPASALASGEVVANPTQKKVATGIQKIPSI
jgi:hypothetical protein